MIDQLDAQLLAMTPPNKVGRLPRNIRDLGDWKASELRAFLLFYGVPCLQDLLPQQYLQHFSYLVRGIYVLLQERISTPDIAVARGLLTTFFTSYASLYGSSMLTINVHNISHLCTKVEDLGPLFCHSGFFYEDLKGISGLYSGTQNVNEQICKNVSIQQGLPHLAKYMLPGSPAFNLYKKITSHQKIKSSLGPISDQISVLPHFTNVGDTEMARKLPPEAKVVRF